MTLWSLAMISRDRAWYRKSAMTTVEKHVAMDDISASLDQIAAFGAVQSNCMFQLALMLARIAVESCAESYKEETAQALMGLIRVKPKNNVVRLFDGRHKGGGDISGFQAVN